MKVKTPCFIFYSVTRSRTDSDGNTQEKILEYRDGRRMSMCKVHYDDLWKANYVNLAVKQVGSQKKNVYRIYLDVKKNSRLQLQKGIVHVGEKEYSIEENGEPVTVVDRVEFIFGQTARWTDYVFYGTPVVLALVLLYYGGRRVLRKIRS